MTQRPNRLCYCGSNKPRRPLYDARSILVSTSVCDDCINRVKSGYRPEIFTDPDYETTEPIEEE